MKFVTVMDMWLLLMNGVLLGAILYYGRKLIALVARAVSKQDDKNIEEAILEERNRTLRIIDNELNTFKAAVSMGDNSYSETIQELKVIRELIKK